MERFQVLLSQAEGDRQIVNAIFYIGLINIDLGYFLAASLPAW